MLLTSLALKVSKALLDQQETKASKAFKETQVLLDQEDPKAKLAFRDKLAR